MGQIGVVLRIKQSFPFAGRDFEAGVHMFVFVLVIQQIPVLLTQLVLLYASFFHLLLGGMID